ncbi:MAG: response regulator [Desulfobacteraceae bacterium]|nr:MAG: response regulator [Desulfobacteraceae bacterium]
MKQKKDNTLRTLIVDDRQDNLYLLKALLQGNGHEVVSANHGAEALEELKKGRFDLIISDILMPVMDGFQLCRIVKTDPALSHIPFIIYTATYTGPQDEDFAIKIGADRFIIKPCEPNTFMEAVHDVMAKAGRIDIDRKQQPQEEEVLKLYNERLVRKLEQKMQQLEKETGELLKTQEALRISEKKYRRLHESMADGFAYVDMQGYIRESNESFQKMLGYTEDELSRMTYMDLTPEKWHAFEQDIVANQVFINNYSEVYEKEYQKKDGTIFPVELKVFLLRNDLGEKEGIWAIVRDITERKNAEKEKTRLTEQLRQAQKLEAVGQLAGGVAHDFNNMLSVILGYTELVLGKTDPADPLRADFNEVFNAAGRARDITRQLLAFARQQAIDPRPLDLNLVVEGMLKMLRRLIGEGIDLVWCPKKELWPILMDASQIDQILANLCINARDAIHDVGKIIMETKNVRIEKDDCSRHAYFVPGGYVMLTVSDNGCGMDRKTIDKIFEPFFTTKEKGKGTGLGLATIYGIVKQNQGFVNVYSEPGMGTTFRVYLPRYEGALPTNDDEDPADIPKGKDEMVLVVEDEPTILDIAVRFLETLGYRTLTAGTPDDAIRIAGNHNGEIHLLMTDLIMPGMNGRDLAGQIRNVRPEIKCLFMSGYTADVIAHHGILEADVQFIQKPFSSRDLAIKVRAVLDM